MNIAHLAQGNKMSRLQPVAGTEIVDDIRLGHTWGEYYVLEQFITDEQPDWFVEVGVHEGGLSYLLIPKYIIKNYVGIELDCGIIRPQVKLLYEQDWAKLICADCFSDKVADAIGELGGKKIIYCDGGNKAKELKHFWIMCNEGDIIMAHDYHDGIRIVPDVSTDYQPEVHPRDILHLAVNESFERLSEHRFKETRIVGFRKIK